MRTTLVFSSFFVINKAQSQKRVVKLNNAFRVSDRPTCLTFCCNIMS